MEDVSSRVFMFLCTEYGIELQCGILGHFVHLYFSGVDNVLTIAIFGSLWVL